MEVSIMEISTSQYETYLEDAIKWDENKTDNTVCLKLFGHKNHRPYAYGIEYYGDANSSSPTSVDIFFDSAVTTHEIRSVMDEYSDEELSCYQEA